ncbi:ATP-binding protein [Bacillus sp. CGMCC 1.16541]|uniref:ATP-binding protein n=1 Tax=Bacillus sp. CGMCC 1.16541 TaxID=2185143 RepID=UPI000D73EB59|nr:ATP-binding protein [Bacillus sp. CGMCC 1.16541]
MSVVSQEIMLNQFNEDTNRLCYETERLLNIAYPSYSVNPSNNVLDYIEEESSVLLDGMTFYRLVSCTIDSDKEVETFIKDKISKFLTAIHSLNVTIAYGVISYNGSTNLVLGVNNKKDAQVTKSIIEGLLSGIELNEMRPDLLKREKREKNYGMIAGVPTTVLNDKPQIFDIAPVMKSLNGQNYSLLFLAKPYSPEMIRDKISTLIEIKDACFSISKRNISRQSSQTDTTTDTESEGENKSKNKNVSGAGAGLVLGGAIGAGIGSIVPGAGTVVGAKLGATIGTVIGASVSFGTSEGTSKGWSQAVSNAITNGESISGDVQNGFAIELMNYADNALNRLKEGQNTGVWQTAISYSSDSEIAKNIIQACLCGEISKPNPNLLPLRAFSASMPELNGQEILLPKNILNEDNYESPLCTTLNSAELGMFCSFPSDSVPNFEVKKGKHYPMVSNYFETSENVVIGKIADGLRVIKNMPFGLSEADLNKHTFVCGITGSGKTTTVKGILRGCKKPFMVIESAKKEYRNIKLNDDRKPIVYTMGKPEINCLSMNPFFVMGGIGLHTHIDFLKDLFNASFSFYGPMPYILEHCLHNIYLQKGWNLTLGFHPYLVNQRSSVDFFDLNFMKSKISLKAHKFIYPTMQDLKNEVERYIEEDMQYDGEVAGNVKTAILSRLDSLCNGAKGFMFNTNEIIDMEHLLTKDVIFELEGLADDSDKAFCVGLLVIFINEYRQVYKEILGNKKTELQHLLVIEEAHRLLKNVDTERSSENMANPKGKAVEHFSNIIAEMRSYGQGVIIAEQIPSKLAPDVIKNSSNKIIQRVVSVDDQTLVANTIGIRNEDAIYIGNLSTGYALCHKEGMNMPVQVKINTIQDDYVNDALIYNKDLQKKMYLVNLNYIKSTINNEINEVAIRLLNCLLIEESPILVDTITQSKDIIRKSIKIKDIQIIMNGNINDIISNLITDSLTEYLMNGLYSVKEIISNTDYEHIQKTIKIPSEKIIDELKNRLSNLYKQNTKEVGTFIIAEQIKYQMKNGIDIRKSINNYLPNCSETTIIEIENLVAKKVKTWG